MSLVMLCFPCCEEEQPPPRRRPKIDRSMIGEPTGFKHTGHIGSGEVATGFDIHSVQDQMQSKGGYEYNCALSTAEPDGIDLSHQAENNDTGDNSEKSNGQTEEDSPQPNRTEEPNQL
ncbi:CDC42 small effector protein 2-C-like [Rhopilema esculentum]|uniref:CDC42 small effector protein 2-C-like n=1 Tax=Rhopilema esculentum TaxID=499914 RepID=UPI0031DCA32D